MRPSKVWQWYMQRRTNILSTKPNPAHISLARMEHLFDSLVISTQNIDGLHARAGSSNILELHGNIFKNKCLECGEPYLLESDSEGVPCCPLCEGLIRPDVVWFGETLPSDIWDRSYGVAMKCDTYLVIGTSGTVQPAASLALIAKRCGARVIIINPQESALDITADLIIQMNSGIALTDICASM